MSAGILRIDADGYQGLNDDEQAAFQGWVTSFFDCNPDRISWVEFETDTTVAKWSMQINLITLHDPQRPTLLSETHVVPITTPVPDGLLKRLAEVGTWVTSSPPTTRR